MLVKNQKMFVPPFGREFRLAPPFGGVNQVLAPPFGGVDKSAKMCYTVLLLYLLLTS